MSKLNKIVFENTLFVLRDSSTFVARDGKPVNVTSAIVVYGATNSIKPVIIPAGLVKTLLKFCEREDVKQWLSSN